MTKKEVNFILLPNFKFLPKVSMRTFELFEKLTGLFRRFIDFEDRSFYTLAGIYVILTYLYDIFDEVPYLQVFGHKGSGKSLLGDLFGGLCFNAVNSSQISDAALYRTIKDKQAAGGLTMILDEQEHLGDSTRRGGIILPMLRSGYRRNGKVTRCGPDRNIEDFPTFCPKIIENELGIHDQALESRTIPEQMIQSERPLEEFRFSKVEGEFKEVRELIRSFCEDYRDLVSDRYLSLKRIDGIVGRDKEVWAPIIIIADLLAALLDAPSIKEDILALAKKIILRRRRTALVGNLDLQILEATRAYVVQKEALQIDSLPFYVGEDVWKFTRDRCKIPGLKLETISRVLKRHEILIDVKRPRVQNIVIDKKHPRRSKKSVAIQRSCYLLDQEKLSKLTHEYFDDGGESL